MLHRRSFWLVAAGVVLLAAAAYGALRGMSGSRAAEPKGPVAVPVTIAAVAVKTVPVRLYAIGNVEPYTTVSLKARVDGQIVSVHFKEGDEVRQGAILFEIDPRPYAASLRQAQANLAKDTALLDRANEQERRYKDLLAKNFISPDAYEQVRTNAETAAATVSGDQAAIENARLSLDYCTIRSPVTGYAGRILIQQGNLVKANDTTPLVTINQVVPIYVVVLGTGTEPRRHPPIPGGRRTAGSRRTSPTRGTRRSRASSSFIDNAADHDHRHDQAQGGVSEHRQGAVAGPVRQRRDHALRTEGRGRRAVDRRAERPQRAVRLRRQARSDGRTARRQGRSVRMAKTRSSRAASSRASRSSPSGSFAWRRAPG